MERGLITAVALNGAGIVHDFELAVAGHTSEDVAAGLGSGEFGMARETGEEINRAIVEGDAAGLGLGAALGVYLERRAPPHAGISVLAAAHRLGLPATVRAEAATVAGAMKAAAGRAALEALVVSDPSPSVRRNAAWALGKIGQAASRGALMKASGDESSLVRLTARAALAALR
jgi:hypothetical protein